MQTKKEMKEYTNLGVETGVKISNIVYWFFNATRIIAAFKKAKSSETDIERDRRCHS